MKSFTTDDHGSYTADVTRKYYFGKGESTRLFSAPGTIGSIVVVYS